MHEFPPFKIDTKNIYIYKLQGVLFTCYENLRDENNFILQKSCSLMITIIFIIILIYYNCEYEAQYVLMYNLG